MLINEEWLRCIGCESSAFYLDVGDLYNEFGGIRGFYNVYKSSSSSSVRFTGSTQSNINTAISYVKRNYNLL